MSNHFKVSQSKVKTYRRCHQAYHHKYVEKLRRKRKSRPLQFGTMIHEALERHFNGDDAMEYFEDLRNDVAAMRLFAQEREEYGDILVDTEDIIADYLDYWDDAELRPVRKAGRGAEHTFEIELMPGIIFNGKIDLIGKTPNKLRWLVEHKTFSRRPNDDDRWRNLQSVVYFRANDILGWPSLDGCLWDYVKSKPPALPGTLKDGTLSTKKIDTLPATVERVIAEHDPKKLGKVDALRGMAEKNRPQYFQRIHTPVNRAVADLVFDDFEKTVREMVDNHGCVSDMNIDKHCGWCDYEPLCRAKLQGLDVDYVKEREYTDGTKNKKDNQNDEKPVVHKVDHDQVLASSKGK